MAQRPGDWFFFGAVALLIAVRNTDISDGWLLALALALGWAINEAARRRGQNP
jgi:hypothetical protein